MYMNQITRLTQSINNPMDRQTFLRVLPLAVVGLVDSFAFMIIAPSLIFYVTEQGGTQTQYGIILSAFSFSSFLLKPVLGVWTDKFGGKFRAPYLFTIALGTFGHMLYFLASTLPPGHLSVLVILVGRFLAGAGAANSAIGFSYVARVIEGPKLTQSSSVLSTVRIVGTAISPGFNVFLSGLDYKFPIGGHVFHVDPLNGVGLLMVAANLVTFFLIYFMLDEPPVAPKPVKAVDHVQEHTWLFVKNLCQLEIVMPILATFTVNMNWQLLETAIAPVASDALGWTQVAISTLFGCNSLIIFAVVTCMYHLSARGVRDTTLMDAGLFLSVIGYSLLYFWWVQDVEAWMFVLPGTLRTWRSSADDNSSLTFLSTVVLSTLGLPLLGAPTRSFYTSAVVRNDYLRDHLGTMHAILSMVINVPGFMGPGLIASYILQSPAQVAENDHHREFSPYALYAPILSLIALAGMYYMKVRDCVTGEPMMDRDSVTEGEVEERLALLGTYIETGEAPWEHEMRRYTLLDFAPYPTSGVELEGRLQRTTALF